MFTSRTYIYIRVCIITHVSSIFFPQEGEGDEEGTPLSIMIGKQFKDMILKTNKKEQTPLHLAAKNGHDLYVPISVYVYMM